MDSTTLGVLGGAAKRAEIDGGELILYDVQAAQMKTLEITGLTQTLNCDGDSVA